MRIFSAIQPTGEIHIGNYLGFIKQALELQDKGECFYFIVDFHALTENIAPDVFRANVLNTVAGLLALGLDPQKCVFAVQSHIPEVTELMWLLTTIAPVRELERMTQYKDKAQKFSEAGVNAGLLMYPVLMAADILLYKGERVPVGEDQVQHVEFSRSIARKFNSHFGNIFPEPKELLVKEGARIMSLQDPAKKMSKSSEGDHWLGVFEEPESIRKKIQRAVTDSGSEIRYDPNAKPALANLMTVLGGITGKNMKDIEKQFSGKGYADFKKDLAETIVEFFTPARLRRQQLLAEPLRIHALLEQGASKARHEAKKTLTQVRDAMGL